MKKVWDWLNDKLPYLWGFLWLVIITVGSVALLICVVKWLLRLVGVM